MRFELFFRGKRIAALEARIDLLETTLASYDRALQTAFRVAGVSVPLEEKQPRPERPLLRVVR